MKADGLHLAGWIQQIVGADQTMLIDVNSRKWVTMPTRALGALLSYLRQGMAEPQDEFAGISVSQIERTITLLEKQGFLTAADDAAREDPPASRSDAAGPGSFRGPDRKRSLYFHVTRRCNLRCTTCYVAEHLKCNERDLFSLQHIRDLFALAGEHGFRSLTITGGEPFLRKDIYEVLELARAGFSRVAVATNGTRLTRSRFDRLKDLVDSIHISLESPFAAVHDAIRGAGAFDMVMRGLRALGQSGYSPSRVTLMPTITKQNCAGLERLLDLAAEFGVRVSYGFFMPTGRGKCNADRLLPECEEMADLFEASGNKYRQMYPDQTKGRTRGCFDYIKTSCNIADVLAIQFEGSIYPCPNLMSSSHCLGNYFSASGSELHEIFSDPASKQCYTARVVDRVPGCRGCAYRYFCGGGCMASAFESSGDIYGKDPNCMFYQLIWQRHGPMSARPSVQA